MANVWIPFPMGSGGSSSDEEIELYEVHATHAESHNNISGNPIFKVRLACPWVSYSDAVSQLLGKPQKWPHQSVFNQASGGGVDTVYANSIELITDQGDAIADINGQKLDYKYFALFDVTYIQRKGIYTTLTGTGATEDVYIEEEIQQRYETIPMNNMKLVWGDAAGDADANSPPLLPNEAPVRFDVGETLVRTIEGWTKPLPSTGPIVGTVNQATYTSVQLNKTFPAKTLCLRSINITKQYSFRSYRPQLGTPNDPSGKPTLTVRLNYEFRAASWDYFWKHDLKSTVSPFGYYANIHRNAAPYQQVHAFPPADHSVYLGP